MREIWCRKWPIPLGATVRMVRRQEVRYTATRLAADPNGGFRVWITNQAFPAMGEAAYLRPEHMHAFEWLRGEVPDDEVQGLR